MNRRQFIQLGFIGSALSMTACTMSEVRRSINTGKKIIDGQYSKAIASQVPGTGIPEIDSLMRQGLTHFLDEITETWQDKTVPTTDTYVKYSDHYKSRAIINFSSGEIIVETQINQGSKSALKKAIVQTLLTPEDPAQNDLYSAKPPKIGKMPFLYELVQDQDRKPVRYAWRANRYANYLLKNRFQAYQYKGHTRYAVHFKMVANYRQKQQKHLNLAVQTQARRYGLDPATIFGIIETESSFNPYAVSSAPAYGLMQIVPKTAGRDVYRFLHNRDGLPSKQMLFSAMTNIKYGTTYLHILKSRYLRGIQNRQSLEYCMISAYNTGAGNVLSSFDRNQSRAIRKINQLSSSEIYQHLRQNLSSSEARNYIKKVVQHRKKYLNT